QPWPSTGTTTWRSRTWLPCATTGPTGWRVTPPTGRCRPAAASVTAGTCPSSTSTGTIGATASRRLGGDPDAPGGPAPLRRRPERRIQVVGPGRQQLAGVAPIDVADEGRVDVVAEELLQAVGQRRGDGGRNDEDMVLDRPQPGGGVVENDAEAVLLAR